MKRPNVYIAGWGSISSLGTNDEEMIYNLKKEAQIIQPLKHFSTQLDWNPAVGEAGFSNQALQELLHLPNVNSRTSLLACFAAQKAIQNAHIDVSDLNNAAFISSTTVGGMDVSEKEYQFQKDISVLQNMNHLCGASTKNVVEFLGIKGFFTTINTACSSAANAMMLGARMIQSGKTKIAIVGGTDALCEFTIQGFNALQLLSKEWCKPFDAQRNGLNLGEGAAYLVLISEDLIKKYKPKAQLVGWANTNDAYHQTASSPEGIGAALAMEKALHLAQVSPQQVDYINAHGTATPNNDASEVAAMKKVFKKVPDFSSTKAFTGHALAAAGAIEAVVSLLAIESQMAFANLNCSENESNLMPLTVSKYKKIDYVMSNSFGFGGNCSSLIFKKYEACL